MKTHQVRIAIARTLPALFECAPAPQAGVRVRTPLVYPDGGVVDVFVLEQGKQVTITDFGEALGRLRIPSVTGGLSTATRRLADDVCQTLGVGLERGQLTVRVGPSDALAEAVLRVAQAAVQTASLGIRVECARS